MGHLANEIVPYFQNFDNYLCGKGLAVGKYLRANRGILFKKSQKSGKIVPSSGEEACSGVKPGVNAKIG